jgi:hypothetical protein
MIKRGQSRGLSKGFFSALLGGDEVDEAGQVSNVKEVGYFKGVITVLNKEED